MPVEDVFSIKGRGTVVTGRIERGVVKVGDEVEIVGLSEETVRQQSLVLKCSKRFLKMLKQATMLVASFVVLIRMTLNAVKCFAKPGSITPHTKFEGEVYVLTKEEGGRHTPFFSGYKPQFYFRTTDVTGKLDLNGWRRNVHARRQCDYVNRP